MSDDPLQHDDLPPAIKQDLADLYGSVPRIPSITDAAILNLARAKLADRRRARLLWRITSLAAAAAILLFSIQLTLRPHSATHPTAATAAFPQDLNGDGRVDIVDAFYLARAVERSQSKPQWDFNHDGVIDRRDADTIAANAVSLKGAPPQ